MGRDSPCPLSAAGVQLPNSLLRTRHIVAPRLAARCNCFYVRENDPERQNAACSAPNAGFPRALEVELRTMGLASGSVSNVDLKRLRAVRERVLRRRAVWERALRLRAVRERALRERAVWERAVRERAVWERALRERALRERAVRLRVVRGRCRCGWCGADAAAGGAGPTWPRAVRLRAVLHTVRGRCRWGWCGTDVATCGAAAGGAGPMPLHTVRGRCRCGWCGSDAAACDLEVTHAAVSRLKAPQMGAKRPPCTHAVVSHRPWRNALNFRASFSIFELIDAVRRWPFTCIPRNTSQNPWSALFRQRILVKSCQ